jgi:hypothetical protein
MYNEQAEYIREYYKDKDFVIVGLNDSQGVNTNLNIFGKGMFESIVDVLKPKTFINAFSLRLNKTYHIDWFLKSDLSKEEIQLSKVYSFVEGIRQVAIDFNLPNISINVPLLTKLFNTGKKVINIDVPKMVSKLGLITKMIYKIEPNDKNIKISSSLKEASEPIVIYSSGVNDLMREVGSNPVSITKKYKERHENEAYFYSVRKAEDPRTLETALNNIRTNLDNLLAINPTTDIYLLGVYLPSSLKGEGMQVFRDLAEKYNNALKEIATDYDITFVNTELLEPTVGKTNFHASVKGHVQLNERIIDLIHKKKQQPKLVKTKEALEIEFGGGIEKAIELAKEEITLSPDILQEPRFDEKIIKGIGKELESELRVLEEVLNNKSK